MIFRKPYQATGSQLTDNTLITRKNNYLLDNIVQRDARKLGLKHNIVNIFSLSLLLSSATLAFIPQVDSIIFVLIFVISLLFFSQYKLRAMVSSAEGNGVSLTHNRSSQKFLVIKSIQLQLVHQLKTHKEKL
ncbi:hypothetical protein [Vibrio sp. VB16]|uniref:hypothetical protein n=1 Tax=Vibrio sp. VB16 TaxID=2785746 RepID=UPI0018A0CF62|nr:hypothetical protein [Vibrio sp. VB16]UGA55227.1 hypothetical protein IUZ65_002405 [Vibrio sp. VB16]